MKTNHAERLASVETELRALREDVCEIHGDVKKLLEAYNNRRGVTRFLALLWAGLLSLGGLLGGLFMGRGHG